MSLHEHSPLCTPPESSRSEGEKPKKAVLVELKNGKIVFKQKLVSFEKMSETMQGASLYRSIFDET